nr:MAG TPA: hypothetical protein [Caudoviricetes sp.]
MSQYNRRIVELKVKYPQMGRFVRDILFAFVPVVNSLHAEYMMEKDPKR